jgi:nucleoside-diphosphate-sugar epimerase
MRVLIVGCGYVGLPLGTELVRQGHEVFGLRRNAAAEAELKAARIKPLFADITMPEDLAKLPREFDGVVNCAASGGGGDGDNRRLYLLGNRNLIEWLRPVPPKRYVYTSSTSVYGQNDGSTVVETDPVAPLTETGKVLVMTENLLLAAATEISFPTVILRLAGIYGPGRGYWLKQFLSNEARIEGKGERFLNMIHRDDVVGLIIAALKNAPLCSVYNAVDNEPVGQLDFFQWLAERLGKPLPPSASEDSEVNRKRGVTNKRVSNRRLRRQLGYGFKYPTFRQGYSAEIIQLEKAGLLDLKTGSPAS